MRKPTNRQPDWTVRYAIIAGAAVTAVFALMAMSLPNTPSVRGANQLQLIPFQIIAQDKSATTQLRRLHVVVPPKSSRTQIEAVRKYLDGRYQYEANVNFLFYDDAKAALQQFRGEHPEEWDRHLLAQYLRSPGTRAFGRPTRSGFTRW